MHPFRGNVPDEDSPDYLYFMVKREIFMQFVLCVWYLSSLPTSPDQSSGNGATTGNATMPATPALDSPRHQDPSSNLLIYALLSLLAILPRLWLGRTAMASYGANMMSTRWHGMFTALSYQCAQALCPRWLQWTMHFLLPGAPFPSSVPGLEWVLISIFAFSLGFHPALAFGTYHVADAFIHPLRRQLQDACEESELLRKQRNSLFWFGRLYIVAGTLGNAFPAFFSAAAAIGLVLVTTGALVIWVLAFAILPRTFPAESKPPKPRQGRRAPKFTYTSLKDSTTIRLLRIEPSPTDAFPMRCSLLQVPLGGSIMETPEYVAISHKWPDLTKNQLSAPIANRSLPTISNNATEGPLDGSDERDGFLEDIEHDGGDPTSNSTASAYLLVNGYEFPVHPDIFIKLRDLRSPIRHRCVWIDNICIDQQNKAERAQQVSLMNQIYANANHVVACLLGLENVSYGFLHRVRRFFHVRLTPDELEVHKLDTMIYRLRDSRLLQDFSARDSPASVLSIGDIDHWDALHRLVSNPWFRRVWMLQEITIAKRIEFRYCGADIDWSNMVRSMAALHRSGLRGFRQLRDSNDQDSLGAIGIDGAMIYDNLRRWRQEGKLLSLLDTLILCLRFQSGEDVDRIFAMLGVISNKDKESLQIQPDYETDKETIFQKAAWRLLLFCDLNDQFRLLRFAGIGRSRRLKLPSWVPDWTAGLQECVLDHRNSASSFKASSRPPQRVTFVPTRLGALPSTLQLKGVLVDEIVALEDVSETPRAESRLFPIQAALRKAANHWTTRYSSLEDAFWRTLLTDSDFNDRPARQQVVDDYRQTMRRYETLREQQDLNEDEFRERQILYLVLARARSEDRSFSHLLATDLAKRLPDRGGDICSLFSKSFNATHIQNVDRSAGRQFCITKTGYMGLVPRLSKEGDVVVVFHGARTPHVLRPCSASTPMESQRPYELVGECYLHGAMDRQTAGPEDVFIIV